MTIPQLVTGDDTNLVVTLYDANGNRAPSIVGATSVKGALVKADHSATLAGPYTCASGDTGAVWADAVIAIPVLGADTLALVVPWALVEVQVIQAGVKTTYFGETAVQVVHGCIP